MLSASWRWSARVRPSPIPAFISRLTDGRTSIDGSGGAAVKLTGEDDLPLGDVAGEIRDGWVMSTWRIETMISWANPGRRRMRPARPGAG